MPGTTFALVRLKLRDDLTAALKARDRLTASALRSVIAAIENAEAVPVTAVQRPLPGSDHVAGATAGAGSSDVARRRLSEADEIAIVRGQVEEREAAAEEYERLGQTDRAQRLRDEATVIAPYLRPGARYGRRSSVAP